MVVKIVTYRNPRSGDHWPTLYAWMLMDESIAKDDPLSEVLIFSDFSRKEEVEKDAVYLLKRIWKILGAPGEMPEIEFQYFISPSAMAMVVM